MPPNHSDAVRRLQFFLCVAIPIVFAFYLAIRFFGLGQTDGDPGIVGGGRIVWMTSAVVALVNLCGLLWYGSPDPRNRETSEWYEHYGWDDDKRLAVVYVSRGDNKRALERSVHRTSRTLYRMGVRYRIYVVTDLGFDMRVERPEYVQHYVVPDDYQPAFGAQYKARALEFLLRHPLAELDPVNTWVLHLDEESQVHPSAVAGIARFVDDPDSRWRIGQGEIKYNAYRYGRNPFVTAIDGIRTGDDLGRFRLQYRMFNRPVFGMHGSFILVPLAIENDIGFDLGAKGSITEDAYFALLSSVEYEFGWVDGYIREQSPFTVREVILQRRRWFNGLFLLAFDRAVPLPQRLPLQIAMLCWALAWASPLMVIVSLVVAGTLPTGLFVLAVLTQGSFASVYVVGAYRNLCDLDWPWGAKGFFLLLPIVLMPVSAIVEASAVVYAMVKPVRTFDVVDKHSDTSPSGIRMLRPELAMADGTDPTARAS